MFEKSFMCKQNWYTKVDSACTLHQWVDNGESTFMGFVGVADNVWVKSKIFSH